MDQARTNLLIEKSYRLADAGVTWDQIETRRHEVNAAARAVDENAVELDFNQALEVVYRETFTSVTV